MTAPLTGVVPVVPTRRSRDAQDMGAAMVMIMPPFFGATMAVQAQAVIDYFKTVADAIDIPIMVQDAPLSTTPLPANLLIDLIKQVPRVQYVKVEVPQAADKLHCLVSALGSSLPGPFDGEESVTLIPDLDAGAAGTMPSSMVAGELGRIVRQYFSGDRAAPQAPGRTCCRLSISRTANAACARRRFSWPREASSAQTRLARRWDRSRRGPATD